jgi:hypothetical protein
MRERQSAKGLRSVRESFGKNGGSLPMEKTADPSTSLPTPAAKLHPSSFAAGDPGLPETPLRFGRDDKG